MNLVDMKLKVQRDLADMDRRAANWEAATPMVHALNRLGRIWAIWPPHVLYLRPDNVNRFNAAAAQLFDLLPQQGPPMILGFTVMAKQLKPN